MNPFSYLRAVVLFPFKLETIMTTQAQLVEQLTALTSTVAKIQSETQTLLDRVADLTQAVEDAKVVSPEVQSALAALTAQVAIVDGLVPDAAPEVPEEPTEPGTPEEPTEPETTEEPVDPETPVDPDQEQPAP